MRPPWPPRFRSDAYAYSHVQLSTSHTHINIGYPYMWCIHSKSVWLHLKSYNQCTTLAILSQKHHIYGYLCGCDLWTVALDMRSFLNMSSSIHPTLVPILFHQWVIPTFRKLLFNFFWCACLLGRAWASPTLIMTTAPACGIMLSIYVSIYVSFYPAFVAPWFLRSVYALKCSMYSSILTCSRALLQLHLTERPRMTWTTRRVYSRNLSLEGKSESQNIIINCNTHSLILI